MALPMLTNYMVITRATPKGGTDHALVKMQFSSRNVKEGGGILRSAETFDDLMSRSGLACLYGSTTSKERLYPTERVTNYLYEVVRLLYGPNYVESMLDHRSAGGIVLYTKYDSNIMLVNKKTIDTSTNTALMKAGGKLLDQTIISIPLENFPTRVLEGKLVYVITCDVIAPFIFEAIADAEVTKGFPYFATKTTLVRHSENYFNVGTVKNQYSFAHLQTLGLNRNNLPLLESFEYVKTLSRKNNIFNSVEVDFDMLGENIMKDNNKCLVRVKATVACQEVLSRKEFEAARIALFGAADIKIFSSGVETVLSKSEIRKKIKNISEFLGGTGVVSNEAIVCVANGSTIDDLMKFGVEFETGASNLPTIKNGPSLLQNGHYDGGGIEVNTPTMKNPTVYSFFATYDTFLKLLRTSNTFAGTVNGSSTHIHFSFAQGNKHAPLRGMAMSTYSAIIKFYAGLTLFDGFNYGGRRNNGYGKPIRLLRAGTIPESRAPFFSPSTDDYVIRSESCRGFSLETIVEAGRSSVLRACGVGSYGKDFHFEYRGTDHCVSAVFIGLKIELLKGIMRYAAAMRATNTDYDLSFIKKFFSCQFTSQNDVALHSYIIRKAAIDMVEELSDFLPRDVKKALLAWATTVSYYDPDTGALEWYRRNEYHIIKELNFPRSTLSTDIKFEKTRSGNLAPVGKDMKIFSASNYSPASPSFCNSGQPNSRRTPGDDDRGAIAVRVGKSKRILSYIDTIV